MAIKNGRTSNDMVVLTGAGAGAAAVVIAATAAVAGAAVAWLLARRTAPRLTDAAVDIFDAAPWDDEPLSAEELVQIAASEAEIARGEVVPWEESYPASRRQPLDAVDTTIYANRAQEFRRDP